MLPASEGDELGEMGSSAASKASSLNDGTSFGCVIACVRTIKPESEKCEERERHTTTSYCIRMTEGEPSSV